MSCERCQGGWLGTDHLGRPIPCLSCKPHLAGPTALVYDCDPAAMARRAALPQSVQQRAS